MPVANGHGRDAECAAVAARAVQRGEDAEADRHHHGRRRRVAHPHRDGGRDEAEPREHARGRSADPGDREERQRDAPVEPVNRHRARQHEAADEEEHDRVGEVGEHLPGRRDAERDAEDRAEQRRDGQRQRLADPQHHHCGQDRRHHLALRPEAAAGQMNGRECQRREHDTGCAPAALECGFERGNRLGRLGVRLAVVGTLHSRLYPPRQRRLSPGSHACAGSVKPT